MSRSVAWRRICPDNVKQRIEEALDARFYILRETGPTGFLVKQDDSDAKLKVFLGDPNSCTCGVFVKEKELCIHILWVMLRKFRISKENPLIFQKALVEREINELIQGIHVRVREEKKRESIMNKNDDQKDKLKPKTIDEDDVCPICQEDLINCKEPLTHCKFGCGNNIHIKCMKVWAQHRKTDGENIIKCPLCRSDFGSYQDVIQEFHSLTTKRRSKVETNDLHIGATCQNCKMSPIQGKCYRCAVCIDYHLCQNCFANKKHPQHSFQFRKNTNKRWRPATRNETSLPLGILNNLQNRDITDEDYDLLLRLDRPSDPDSGGNLRTEYLTLEILRSNSDVIKRKDSCEICMQLFTVSQCVRRLACNHTFHRQCIGNWIYNGNSTCPLDGQRIQAKIQLKSRDIATRDNRPMKSGESDTNQLDLAIFGVNSSFKKVFSKPPMQLSKINRKWRKSSLSDMSEVVMDISELAINGMQKRSTDIKPEHDITSRKPISGPAFPNRNRDSNNNHHKQAEKRLPPIHPTKRQVRSHSGNNIRRDKDAREITNQNERTVFGSSPSLSIIVGGKNEHERKVISTKRRPVTTKHQPGIGNKLSSSEPNLLSLSEVLKVNGQMSTFNDSGSAT